MDIPDYKSDSGDDLPEIILPVSEPSSKNIKGKAKSESGTDRKNTRDSPIVKSPRVFKTSIKDENDYKKPQAKRVKYDKEPIVSTI